LFVSLAGGRARGAEEGPLLLLQGCHQRIRTFTALAVKLLDAEGVPAREVAEAAAAVLRYFTEALPKHVEDEEESLRPRLDTLAPPGALAQMAGQHRELEAVLAALADPWLMLAREPVALAEVRAGLRPPTLRMAGLWEPHLQLEEREIFPQLASLPSDARAAIWTEMRGRRGMKR
jgi:hemerythrin-like domain-containing protein